ILVRSEINRQLKTRQEKQARGLFWGDFFKNPNGFPSAEWLVEQSGCKEGLKVGGARLASRRAHFLLNTKKATSQDVIQLALKIHKEVKQKFDTHLEPEVQILPQNPF